MSETYLKSNRTRVTWEMFKHSWPGLKLVKAFSKPDTLFAYRFGGRVLIPSQDAWDDIHNPDGMRLGHLGVLFHEFQHLVQDSDGPLEAMRCISPAYRSNRRGAPAYAHQLLVIHTLGSAADCNDLVKHAVARGVEAYAPTMARPKLRDYMRAYLTKRLAAYDDGDFKPYETTRRWLLSKAA